MDPDARLRDRQASLKSLLIIKDQAKFQADKTGTLIQRGQAEGRMSNEQAKHQAGKSGRPEGWKAKVENTTQTIWERVHGNTHCRSDVESGNRCADTRRWGGGR